jgi:Uma2 family endonuclease
MTTAVKVSPAEYLELERKAVFKSEYVDGTIVPVPGATREHNLIETNIIGELRQQLKGRDCEVYGGHMKVRVPVSYRYPDATVVCGTPLFEDLETDVLLNPTVIFEILSKSTEMYDRGDKFTEYRQRESLQAYVLVSQLMPRIEIYKRQGSDWLFSEISGLDKVLRLSEIYDKLNFEQA